MKMRFLSHANSTHFLVKEISFSYERMSTKTHFFEKEAKGNSKMAYSLAKLLLDSLLTDSSISQSHSKFLINQSHLKL